MDVNDHIIRSHILEADFSPVCDISRDNYSQAVHAVTVSGKWILC